MNLEDQSCWNCELIYKDKMGLSTADWYVFPVREGLSLHIAGREVKAGDCLVVCVGGKDKDITFHSYSPEQVERHFERR